MLVLALVVFAVSLPLPRHAAAQINPDVRDRIIPAAVQIAVVMIYEEDGASGTMRMPVGSGTIISPQGLILTNAHVVDMQQHRAALQRWQTRAANQGHRFAVELVSDRVMILIPDALGRPTPTFLAMVSKVDGTLDAALLQVVADVDGDSVRQDELNLAFVPLGDSDSVQLGDPIDVFGYPLVGGEGLTYTTGVVSGFHYAEDSTTRAWITTDATLSGGSSGGTVVNRAGELIAVPTLGSFLDCRPGDTNRDGSLTRADVGCVPVGGSLGELRPINLIKEFLHHSDVLV